MISIDPEFDRQMEVARAIMKRRRTVLRLLAAPPRKNTPPRA